MKRFMFAAVFFVLPITGFAQEALSPDAFDRYTRGKTIFFNLLGTEFGAEQYFPNRRVIWAYADGTCIDGQWYVEQEQICFVYDGQIEPQCWSFFLQGGRLKALFENDPEQTTLYELRKTEGPLICPGPNVGV
ncbi:MAG: hypothetical protein ABJO67_07430 [Pseudoruegeria sp.]